MTATVGLHAAQPGHEDGESGGGESGGGESGGGESGGGESESCVLVEAAMMMVPKSEMCVYVCVCVCVCVCVSVPARVRF